MVSTVSCLTHMGTGPSGSGEEDFTFTPEGSALSVPSSSTCSLATEAASLPVSHCFPLMLQPQGPALLTSDPVHLGFGSAPSLS